MIGIINYGLGNVNAFHNIFKKIGFASKIISNPEELFDSKILIFPGVGHFDSAVTKFKNSGFMPIVENLIFKKNIPILGVCVGMQIFADESEEGNLPGLGWIPGKVLSFKKSLNKSLPIPHMGWNNIEIKKDCFLKKKEDLLDNEFYFLHSYFFKVKDEENSLAKTNYKFNFDSIVYKNNIFGVQFHPEKSHIWGELFLTKFCNFYNATT